MFTAQMMQTLMLDLLDLAQLENRSLRINNEYYDLEDTIDKAFLILSHAAAQKNVVLEKKIGFNQEDFFQSLFGD